MGLFKKKYTELEEKQFEFLQRNILFKDLSPESLSLFLPILHQRSYNLNEVVFFKNDPSQAIYIIRSGKVKLYADTIGGEEDLITIEEGYIFGQNALLKDTKRHYNAIVMEEETELYAVPQVAVHDIFNKHPKIHAQLTTNLATYYNDYIGSVFENYRKNYGLFEMKQVYNKSYKPKTK